MGSAKMLPETAGGLIPSLALDALLAKRDAAVAHLRAISAAVHAYTEIGRSIWTEDGRAKEPPYSYRDPVSLRPNSRGAYLDDANWAGESIKAMDAALWDHMLTESGLWTFFDSKAREEWRKQIDERATPPLTPDNIRATFEQLYAQRGVFFERGVVELFRALSWDYKTNRPIAFGKRIIIRGVTSGFGRNTDKLDDLDRAFHLLDGKPEPDHRSSIGHRIGYRYEPKAETFETPYLRLKTFKNRNGHVEFLRPDLVERLNLILARNGPRDLARATEVEAR